MNEELLNLKQASEFLDCSEQTVRHMLRDNLLVGKKLKGRWWISKGELERAYGLAAPNVQDSPDARQLLPYAKDKQSNNHTMQLEASLAEYQQIKEEIRVALDVYDKIYSVLIGAITLVAAIIATATPNQDAIGLVYAFLPFVILGVLGVVWYGHQVSLLKLSARLEVVEHYVCVLSGKPNLLNWQSHWVTINPKTFLGNWQQNLALLAMLPSFAIYFLSAWASESWWATQWKNLIGTTMYPKSPLVIYSVVFFVTLLSHHGVYVPKLKRKLIDEVARQKEEQNHAIFNNHTNARMESTFK